MTQRVGSQYAVTLFPTPVFNTPDLARCFGGEDGNTLPLDTQGLMRTVETVLFPRAKLELLERIAQSSIWRIRTDEYAYDGNHYIDERFIQFADAVPPNRTFQVPSLPKIIQELEKLEGTRYIWGGNWPFGIDLVPQLFPSRTPLNRLDPLIQDTWKFKGVDCTGLIHYVTNGWTPRNTSSLVNFGNPVLIEGLSIEKILDTVQDLDLIVWEGHAVSVLGPQTSIESKRGWGVIKYDLFERLSHIMQKRRAVDDWEKSEGLRFVVRRWHPDNIIF
jgi:hypothetical protein